MTPDEEHEFYARPENQTPQGPPRQREEPPPDPMPVQSPPEDRDEDYDPTEKGAAGPMRSVTLDQAFLRVAANDLWEESGFDIEVGDTLNIYGERGPDPILPDDFDPEEYFRRYGL